MEDLPFNFKLDKVNETQNNNSYNYQYIIYFLLFNIACKITENNNNEIKTLDEYNKATEDTHNDEFIKKYIKILQSIDKTQTNTNLYDIVKNILDEAITNKTKRTEEAQQAQEVARLAEEHTRQLAEEHTRQLAAEAERLAEEQKTQRDKAAAAEAAQKAEAARIAAEEAAQKAEAARLAAAEAASQTPDGIRKKFLQLPLYTENINLITMFYNFYEKYFKEGTDKDAANKVIEQIGNEYKLQAPSQQPTIVNSNKYDEWKIATVLCNNTMEHIKQLNLFNINVDDNDTQRDTAVQSIRALIEEITTKITECSTNNIFSMYKAYSSIIAEIVNGAVRVIIKVRNNDDDKNLVEYNSQKKTIKFKDYCNDKKHIEYGPYSDFYDKKSSLSQIYNNLFKNKEATTQATTQATTPQTYHNFNAKISAGGTIVLFGYGFSGSGKTYTLIEGSKDTEDTEDTNNQSILNQFIQQHADNISNIEFSEIYPYNAYKNKVVLIPQTDLIQNTNIKDSIDKIVTSTDTQGHAIDNKVKGDKIISLIKENITKINAIRIKNLRILQTPNNPESSRSFLQITITLKVGGGKLVIFDMPGSENTVQIKKAMYGYEIFSTIKQEQSKYKDTAVLSISEPLSFVKMTTDETNIFKIYKCYPPPENKNTFVNDIKGIKYVKDTIGQEINTETQHDTVLAKYVFKERLITYGTFKKLIGAGGEGVSRYKSKDINLNIKADEITFEYIGKCCLDITLFFNRRNSLIENSDPIIILEHTQIASIVKNFIDKVIFETPPPPPQPPQPQQKLPPPQNFRVLSKQSIDDTDIKNIKQIYDIPIEDGNLKTTTQEIEIPQFVLNSVEIKELGELCNNRIKFDSNNNCIFKYFKIVSVNNNYVFHLEIDNSKNCISPMIKYFLIFMILIIKNNSGQNTKFACASLLIFVYKYVNFIVEQGKSIVTSLEHLKYFFLANTNQIDIYNDKVNNKEKAMTFNPTDEQQQKDIKNKDSDTILDNPRIYKISTDIGEDIKIDEIVNCGEMKKYKLLEQLQELAHRNTELDTCVNKTLKPEKLDILKCAASPTTRSQTLFIMIAHIKEFYDSTNKNTDPQQSQICDATHATLEFAQSVSSSSGITEQASQEPGAQAFHPAPAQLTQELGAQAVSKNTQLTKVAQINVRGAVKPQKTAQKITTPNLGAQAQAVSKNTQLTKVGQINVRGAVQNKGLAVQNKGLARTRGGYRDNIIKQKTPSQNTKKHNTNNTHNYNLYTKYNKPYKHKTVKKSLKKDKSLFRFNTKLNKIKYTL